RVRMDLIYAAARRPSHVPLLTPGGEPGARCGVAGEQVSHGPGRRATLRGVEHAVLRHDGRADGWIERFADVVRSRLHHLHGPRAGPSLPGARALHVHPLDERGHELPRIPEHAIRA